MVSIQEALRLIQNQEVGTSSTKIPLGDALGYWLAEEIKAHFDLPAFDNSAMDGFAVCGFGESLEVIGEVAAGSTQAYRLEDGQAMRIFTGGKVPENTTAVIMQEKTRIEGSKVMLEEEVIEGKNIRRKGLELKGGQAVFSAGHRITPATIGLLGSIGLDEINVFQKPNIRIIATGNELVEPGEVLREGQIYESNSHALNGALNQFGFSSLGTTRLPDNLEKISAGIKTALEDAEVLLLSGGISVGDYDFVKEALEANGVKEVFYKVFQKPGKPLYFGRKGDKFVFALPGNPASSLTCFYVYVLPLLQKLSGGMGEGLTRVRIPIAHDLEIKFDRPVFLKSLIEESKVSILEGQGSSMIHSLANGNALTFVEGPIHLRAGDFVECLLI